MGPPGARPGRARDPAAHRRALAPADGSPPRREAATRTRRRRPVHLLGRGQPDAPPRARCSRAPRSRPQHRHSLIGRPGRLASFRASPSRSPAATSPRTTNDLTPFPFQKLEVHVQSRELAARVHHAGIGDAELRDQATRAARSVLLAVSEGLTDSQLASANRATTSVSLRRLPGPRRPPPLEPLSPRSPATMFAIAGNASLTRARA